MVKEMRLILLAVMAFLHFTVEAQNSHTDINKNSLLSYTYDSLIERMNLSKSQEIKLLYVQAIIQKAKNEENWGNLVLGYNIASLVSSPEKQHYYSDSIIALKNVYQDKYNPAEAYLYKGNYFYKKRNFKESLDHYLAAESFEKKNNNENLQFRINYSIAILKDRIDQNDNVLRLHHSNYKYAKKHIPSIGDENYLSTIFALSNGLRKSNKLDSASFYNNLGLKESIRLQNTRKYNFFRLNSGILAFSSNRYQVAKDSLYKAIENWDKLEDSPNIAVSHFFLAKSYAETDSLDKAINHFKKVDSIFITTNDILPELRDSYTYLIDFYNKEESLENELVYVKRLLRVDSILQSNHQYLYINIKDQYEIPQLIAKREEIIKRLEKWNMMNSLTLYILIPISLLIFVVTIVQTYRRKRLSKIYARLDAPEFEMPQIEDTKIDDVDDYTAEVPDEILTILLESLSEFEDKLGFLDKNLTLIKLSNQLNTNTSYLSKTINTQKKQSFTTYLKVLRTNYAFNFLKSNDDYEKYTIKAIAGEFGFKSAESFSKAFREIYDIYPSSFIKQLKSTKNKNK